MFFLDLTQASSDVIVMVALKLNNIKEVQMMKHLYPLKKLFGLSLLRGQDKNTYVRAIANSLLELNYVEVTADADLVKLKREDVTSIKEVVL